MGEVLAALLFLCLSYPVTTSKRPHKERLPRPLFELVAALRTHVSLLLDYRKLAFQKGDVRYYGEVATKLRLLFCPIEGNRHHIPLAIQLMTEFGCSPVVSDNSFDGPQMHRLEKWLSSLNYLTSTALGPREFTTAELIRTWAEQNGAAHEDWDWSPGFRPNQHGGLRILGQEPEILSLRNATDTLLGIATDFLKHIDDARILAVNRVYCLRVLNDDLFRRHPSIESDCRYYRAVCLLELDQPNDAIVELLVAQTIDPKKPRVIATLGECYQRIGNFPVAISYFEKALEFDWKKAIVAYNLACCHARLGRLQLAIEHIKWVSELSTLPELYPELDADLSQLAIDTAFRDSFNDACKKLQTPSRKPTAPIERSLEFTTFARPNPAHAPKFFPFPPPLRRLPLAHWPPPSTLRIMDTEQINLLITMYYDPASSFINMAAALDVSVSDIIELLDHPDIRARIERIDAAAEVRLKSLEIHARIDCMTALASHGTRGDIDTTGQRETARKAASLIYRGRPVPRVVPQEPAGEPMITSTEPCQPPHSTNPSDSPTQYASTPASSPASSSSWSSSSPAASPSPSDRAGWERRSSSRSSASSSPPLAVSSSSPP